MNVYFEVAQDSCLYRDYFRWFQDREKVSEAFKQLREKYGIEATVFYLQGDRLRIDPTEKDRENLKPFLLKGPIIGEFRKGSPMSKEWREAVKSLELTKPQLFNYFRLTGQHWRELLFHDGERLYGKVESDGEVERPDYCRPIKASEYYAILEKVEAEQQK